MGFPILAAHEIGPNFFQLGGRLYPISVRDQMVRAQHLIEQAVQAGLIETNNDRQLLVVGAGAAGATAAMCAGRLQVPTVIADQGVAPFRSR
jgi:alkyl hydroperoxide reductase subunit AhpF